MKIKIPENPGGISGEIENFGAENRLQTFNKPENGFSFYRLNLLQV
ncbi:hypothetical protein [Methanosarcina siciliae]|nr:hypothetical protein [Methanosarcina siciliae]